MAKGLQSAELNTRRRFAAFISYAHADAAIAAKLQSRLERYRLPKHLAQSHTGGQAALGQIFRDREDLAAAPSLSDAIRDAISQAEALIVICSPDAAASRWVGEEIALFRTLHPDGPVLAAVVRGEPEEVFPAALTQGGTEPLAADLRKEGDGEALGFLKIVAGIAGVPLDALVQRDAQRRVRRVMWITGAAMAAMLIMGIMTTLAVQARNEATLQRAEAEGLVEYMLTDLRDKLKGVGRLDVMGAVNDRAKAYYGGSSIKAQLLDAQIMHAMGEDFEKLGELGKASAKFREAHKATSALIEREPDNADVVFTHAQSEYWSGRAAASAGDTAGTERHWLAYLAQARTLLSKDKDRTRANLEMGYAEGNLCEYYLGGAKDIAKALRHCERSIQFEIAALKTAPNDVEIQTALANRYGWLADAYRVHKDYEKARRARDNEQKIVDTLAAKDPKNFELRYRQLWPQFGIATILVEEGRYADSAKLVATVELKCADLSREAPDNVDIKKACARTLYMHTRALLKINRPSAKAALQRTKQLLADIARKPGQQSWLQPYWDDLAKMEKQLTGGE